MSTTKHTLASVAEDHQRVRELPFTELYQISFQAQAVATACVAELASREQEAGSQCGGVARKPPTPPEETARLLMELRHKKLALADAVMALVRTYLLAQRRTPPLDPEILETLLTLAREGRQEDFRWLARSQGVLETDLESLWRGTLARLRPRADGNS